MYAYTVEPLYIDSGSDVIAADFYYPRRQKNPAVIIMAHGFAALRQFKLIQYAQRFAQAGFAVVLFDYCHWGSSTGQPRELVSLTRQLDDWRAVIRTVNDLKSIDSKKMILWGTSLSGGYVLNLATEIKSISAVISQVPYVDGASSVKFYSIQQLTKGLKRSSQDYMGSKIGLKPVNLPVVHPYDLCCIPTEKSFNGFMSIVHPDYFWSGEVPARVLFKLLRYRPIQSVREIKIPILMIAAQQDSFIPIEASREAATNMAPFVQYHEWKMNHFDIYHGEWLEKSISTQLEFLYQQTRK